MIVRSGRAKSFGDLPCRAERILGAICCSRSHALESGVISQEQLLCAARAWAVEPEAELSDVLLRQGLLDASAFANLKQNVANGLEISQSPQDPGATVAYLGPPLGGRTVDRTGDQSHRIGTTRFEVLKPHAKGGIGEVFLAYDSELKRTVALKELQGERAFDADSRARFLLEAELTGRLEHPGVAPVYSLGVHPDGRPFYAMRFIEGETLWDAIQKHYLAPSPDRESREWQVGFRRLLRSVVHACNTVAYAHSRGVVHRDLKPQNIMLGRFGETIVLDWGVAKSMSGPSNSVSAANSSDEALRDASLTQPGSLVGTLPYMSPEQASLGNEQVGAHSDVYSLGAILYCVLSGRPPFADLDMKTMMSRVRKGVFPSPKRLSKWVDRRLEEICIKALSRNPGDRQASALELAGEIESWQTEVRYQGEQVLAVSQVKGSFARLCLERAHNLLGRDEIRRGNALVVEVARKRAWRSGSDDQDELGRVASARQAAGAHLEARGQGECNRVLSRRQAAGDGLRRRLCAALGRFQGLSLNAAPGTREPAPGRRVSIRRKGLCHRRSGRNRQVLGRSVMRSSEQFARDPSAGGRPNLQHRRHPACRFSPRRRFHAVERRKSYPDHGFIDPGD